MDQFLNSLRNRRFAIQARIEREQSRPAPDSVRLYGLKKLKLRFREQIEYLERLNRNGEATSIPVIRRHAVTPSHRRWHGRADRELGHADRAA